MDTTIALPVDWNEWRQVWDEYRTSLEKRYGVRRGVDGNPFPGKNFLADEILGTWTVGQGGRTHPVELSEVTFPALDGTSNRTRYIGVSIDGVGGVGRSELVATFAELDDLLAGLVHDGTMP
jgi:hypothetical protein